MWIKYYQDVEEKKAKQYDPEKLYAIFIVESIKYLSFWSGIQSTIHTTLMLVRNGWLTFPLK